MEKVTRRADSIKRSFTVAVALTLLCVIVCSAATIYGCYLIQRRILPDSREVWLHVKSTTADGTVTEASQRIRLDEPTRLSLLVPDDDNPPDIGASEYMIERIDSSFQTLSAKEKAVYRAAYVCMIAMPLLYSTLGIAICAWWFYRKKIAPPVRVLMEASEHISKNNLDFIVPGMGNDELGQLCSAFEKMRQALYENNRQLWSIIEQRRILQASVAHDLRNPISIIEGYVEYAQQGIEAGKMDKQKIVRTITNIGITAKRLERYTDYIRDLHAIEETQIDYECATLPDFLKDIADAFSVVATQHNKRIECAYRVPVCKAYLDKELVFRVLENIFVNALRYAKESIRFSFALDHTTLSVKIVDDGEGFSDKLLQKTNTMFYSEDTTGEHIGLGLATSRILCQKHGGAMTLCNEAPLGACVGITFSVRRDSANENS